MQVSISGCTLMEAAKRLECNSEEILNKKKTVLQNMVCRGGFQSIMPCSLYLWAGQ